MTNPVRNSILVVEDDADDRYFITRAFKQAIPEVHLDVVDDGQSAVDFLAGLPGEKADRDSIRPRIVLLDLNLPRKTGLEVLKWMRGQAAWKTVVVIVLTSSTSEDDMRQAYAIGANAYTIKPTDATRLREFAQSIRDFWFGWNHVAPTRD